MARGITISEQYTSIMTRVACAHFSFGELCLVYSIRHDRDLLSERADYVSELYTRFFDEEGRLKTLPC